MSHVRRLVVKHMVNMGRMASASTIHSNAWARMVRFTVVGVAAPQGSKRHVGRGIMIESSARLRPWRSTVTAAASEARSGTVTLLGPVRLLVVLSFARPASHYGTGRNAAAVKPSAPIRPTSHAVGDLSKLVRAVEDAITDSGLWRDDSQVVSLVAEKRYVVGVESPNTSITITEVLS